METIGPSLRSHRSETQEPVSRLQSPDAPTVASAHLNTASVSPLVLPPECRAVHLMKLYFSDTGTMFPFINEKQVLASYYSFKRKQFSGMPRSLLCLFNAIFAFATYISAKPEQAVPKNAAESDVFFSRALALCSNNNQQSSDIETGGLLAHSIRWPELVNCLLTITVLECNIFSS